MSAAPGILLGTHLYPARDAAAERLSRALDTWAALDVPLVNLQFADDPSPLAHPGFRTRSVLRRDSRSVTGASGPRKPTMSEMLEHLVEEAERAHCAYAGFSNADILVSPAALDRVRAGGYDAVVFSRMDIDAVSGAALGEFFSGQDTLFIRPAAYRALRSRLRPYIVGEMPWDVVYTSVLLTHCRTELVNRGDDCRHVGHETIWVDSPFASYGWRLARLDWTYMQRWYRYYYAAKAMREAGAAAAEEDAWRDQVFGPLTTRERAMNAYRRVRFGGRTGRGA